MAQHVPPGNEVEVLVVDNGSSDGTVDVISSATAKHVSHTWRYLYEEVPGQLGARHRGATEASGDVLWFLDDDVALLPTTWSGVCEVFSNGATALAGGPSLPDFQSQTPDWIAQFWKPLPIGGRVLPELSLLELDRSGPDAIEPTMIWGLNFAIRKEALLEVGGFHPDCVPSEMQHFQGDGETGLSLKIRKLGMRAVYHPGLAVTHRIGPERLTMEHMEARHFYQGVCDSYTKWRRELRQARDEQSSAPAAAPLLSQRVRSAVRPLVRRLRGQPLTTAPVNDASSHVEEADPVTARLKRAWQRGFGFHTESARRSARLREWIAKDDYFDYRYPELEADFVRPPRIVHEHDVA